MITESKEMLCGIKSL